MFKIASRSLWGNSSWIIFQIKRMKRLILTKTYQNLNSFTAYRSEFFENPSFKRPVREPIRPKFENFHLCNTFKNHWNFEKFQGCGSHLGVFRRALFKNHTRFVWFFHFQPWSVRFCACKTEKRAKKKRVVSNALGDDGEDHPIFSTFSNFA